MDETVFDRLSVVLVAPRNPLNIGAAARAMSNFGCADLRLVNPYDPSFREARSAVGAASLLASAQVYATVAEAVADCALIVGTTAVGAREVLHPLHSLPQAAPMLRTAMQSTRSALLFGSEKTGLTKADLSHCHWLLRIPTQPANYSMNLGQAVAVYVIADAVLRRLHSPLPAVPEFARWRAPQWLLAIYLGALAVYFIARAPAEQVVRAVALNLLLGLGVLYGIVGLAAAYGWLRHRGTPRSRSVALLILGAAVLEAVGMAALVSIFGMLASQVDLASVFADPAGNGRQEP
jgi:tRNA/rRNA methyltransferase